MVNDGRGSGTSTPGGGDMWKHIRLTPNVARSRRSPRNTTIGWSSSFSRSTPNRYCPSFVEPEVTAGTHSSVVVFSGQGSEDTAELVNDMATRFLVKHGTQFRRPQRLLQPAELLGRYGRIQANSVEFAHTKSNLQQLESMQRAVKDASGATVGSLSMKKPLFWINAHHRELMLGKWPFVARTIDSNAPHALNGDEKRRWDLEVAEMRQLCMDQAQTVIAWGMHSGVRRYT